jgi:hypothetical protein
VRELARRRQAGDDFLVISKYLSQILEGEATKPKLIELAKQVAELKHIKLDHPATRSREGVICWLCEQCKDEIMRFEPVHPPSPPRPPVSQDPEPAPPRGDDSIPEKPGDRLEKEFQPMEFSLFDFD